MEDINQLTGRIIGVAIDVHRALGPGLSEIAYERAFCMELAAAGMSFVRQSPCRSHTEARSSRSTAAVSCCNDRRRRCDARPSPLRLWSRDR
jgi:GxxExxY protein